MDISIFLPVVLVGYEIHAFARSLRVKKQGKMG
jgi:hypothetical protein